MSAKSEIAQRGASGLWNIMSKMFANKPAIQTVQRGLTTAAGVVKRNPRAAAGAVATTTLGALFYEDIIKGAAGLSSDAKLNLEGAVADARYILAPEDVPCDRQLMSDIRMSQKQFIAFAMSGTSERGFLDMKNAIASMCYKDLPLYRRVASDEVLAAVALTQMLNEAVAGVANVAAVNQSSTSGGDAPVPPAATDDSSSEQPPI
jgi:hypothetical protein